MIISHINDLIEEVGFDMVPYSGGGGMVPFSGGGGGMVPFGGGGGGGMVPYSGGGGALATIGADSAGMGIKAKIGLAVAGLVAVGVGALWYKYSGTDRGVETYVDDVKSKVEDSIATAEPEEIESIRDYIPTIEDALNFLDRVAKTLDATSSRFQNAVSSYFNEFKSNPYVQELIDYSRENPVVFYGIITTVPLLLIGTTYAVLKNIRSSNDAGMAVKKIKMQLDSTSDPKQRAALEQQLAVVGAKLIAIKKVGG